MRHRNKKAILNRPADQRKALVRNLITSLFLTGKVTTTEAKARALSSAAEKLITKVKRKTATNDNMNAIRELTRVIFTEESSRKALDFVKNTEKVSGYTRLTKVGFRPGDNALKIQVELIKD
jgi:large subunit ribosomal protein L17